MRRIILTAVLSGLVLTGCGSSDDDPKDPPAATAPGTGGGGGAVPPSGDGGTGSVTPQKLQAFLSDVAKIDAGLAAKPDQSLTVALAVCKDLTSGKNDAAAAGAASARLSAGAGVDLELEPSKRFVQAAKTHICRP
ncbi:DUF732 domain-containing protein [Thermomonospora umbrina]|uniref:Uncharacterized protein DUF732 n=1 Tax=Thermomonospora umbrina TaxID=111806 RepID=A0A3D9SUB5_9ACTN|nr:DUF732 domain-containing protein [Thermomonospora umbrina]REE97613.1 uncharacterized protein DUF732 [Thermomonospora umbrina]